jgi:hypothetical protein
MLPIVLLCKYEATGTVSIIFLRRRKMKKLVMLLLLSCGVVTQGAIVNRYSFKDGDTAAVDSISGMNGTLEGTATIAGNQLVLDGSGAVNLPGDILDLGLQSVTIEAWFEINVATNWQRLFDFGETSGGAGGNCIFYTPTSGDNNSRLAIATNGIPSWQTGEVRVDAPIIDVDTPTHIACVYDGAVPELRLYQDGALMGRTTVTSPHSLSGVARMYAYIGDAVYTADPYFNGSVDEFRIYDTALTDAEVLASFNAGPDVAATSKTSARYPNPADEATDVPRDVSLNWTPGLFAETHDVYFGTVFDDVNDASRTNDPCSVLVGQNQEATSYDLPGLLEFGQTYYWRVDEVNAAPDLTIYKGDVWSFTAEPFAYPIQQITATASSYDEGREPEKTIDGSGLDDDLHSTDSTAMWRSSSSGPQPTWIQYEFDKAYKMHEMWVWNYNVEFEQLLGFGFKDVTIEYSTNGTDWQVLGDFEFSQGPSADGYAHNTTIDFGGVTAKYVKLTANSNWKGMAQYGLSEVRFLYKPVRARQPQPVFEGVVASLDIVLSWRAGREAATHELFFSSDSQAVINGTALIDTVSDNSYNLGPLDLDLGKTYYWKVTEVNEAESPNSWESDVWSFTVQDYLAVEDFEQYDDACNRIYYIWQDGLSYSADPACAVVSYAGNGTGSIVGNNNAPFAERTIVHSGNQSMPFGYDNAFAPYYSQTERQWSIAQDWTRGRASALILWLYGGTYNSAEPFYVGLQDSSGTIKVVVHDNPGAIQADRWQQWNIDLIEFDGVDLSSIKKMYIGLGNSTTPQAGGGTGTIYIDDIRLYPYSRQPVDALWLNFSNTGGSWQHAFDFGTGTTFYMFLSPRIGDTGVMRFAITTNSNAAGAESQLNAPSTLASGWHHVAVVIDGTNNNMQLYLDSTVIASGPTETLPSDLGETTQNWLGRSQWSTDGYYSGSLDDFRIYNRNLSELEILYLAGSK